MPELGTSDDLVFVTVVLVAAVALVLGMVERRRHRRRLDQIPWRISVNGSRGKSTVTRLATGALAAGGHRPVGKTTGTEPRLIFGSQAEERSLQRRPEGPNISEQRMVLAEAAHHGADTVVAECMAVVPEYQVTFHEELVQANVVVITNALEDHLDEMGPTTADVAEVFAACIPAGGTVVVAPGAHQERFRAVADERGATFRQADPASVDPVVLRGFDHVVFAEHVALVYALTDHLGISRDDALAGMRAAAADPYATRLVPVGGPGQPALFVNAFPANDPVSTLMLWQHLREQGHPEEKLVVIMNCRADRVARTQQFASDVLPHLPIDTLVVLGEETQAVVRAAQQGDIPVRELRDHTGQPAETAVAGLDGELHDRMVLAVGNLHGAGVGVVDAFEQRRQATPTLPSPPGGA